MVQVRESRFVTIWGEPSVGKSAVAAAVSVYCHERRMFQGVCFARLSMCTTHEHFLLALQKNLLTFVSRGAGSKVGAALQRGEIEELRRIRITQSSAYSHGGSGGSVSGVDGAHSRYGADSYDSPSFYPGQKQPGGVSSGRRSAYESRNRLSGDRDGDGVEDTAYHAYVDSVDCCIQRLEDAILSFLSPLKVLLIFDHLDKLLHDVECAADLKIFIGRLLKGRC
jgi:hypothetical protein